MNVKESGLDTDQQKKSLLKIILKQTNKRKLQENQQMMDKFLCESHLALLFHQLRLQILAIQVECQTEKKNIGNTILDHQKFNLAGGFSALAQ